MNPMIYAILAKRTNCIKFGIAKQVGKRLTGLSVGSPFPLKLLATADWPHEEERRIHAYLRQHWVRGEWFQVCDRTHKVVAILLAEDGLEQWLSISRLGSELPPKRRLARALEYQPINYSCWPCLSA